MLEQAVESSVGKQILQSRVSAFLDKILYTNPDFGHPQFRFSMYEIVQQNCELSLITGQHLFMQTTQRKSYTELNILHKYNKYCIALQGRFHQIEPKHMKLQSFH